MHLSSNFDTVERTEIGLKFPASDILPPLNSGVTIAFFHNVGNWQVLMLRLKIWYRGTINSLAAHLIIKEVMPSSPLAGLLLKGDMASLMSCIVISCNSNIGGWYSRFRLDRSTSGNVDASLSATEVKWVFNLSAFSASDRLGLNILKLDFCFLLLGQKLLMHFQSFLELVLYLSRERSTYALFRSRLSLLQARIAFCFKTSNSGVGFFLYFLEKYSLWNISFKPVLSSSTYFTYVYMIYYTLLLFPQGSMVVTLLTMHDFVSWKGLSHVSDM